MLRKLINSGNGIFRFSNSIPSKDLSNKQLYESSTYIKEYDVFSQAGDFHVINGTIVIPVGYYLAISGARYGVYYYDVDSDEFISYFASGSYDDMIDSELFNNLVYVVRGSQSSFYWDINDPTNPTGLVYGKSGSGYLTTRTSIKKINSTLYVGGRYSEGSDHCGIVYSTTGNTWDFDTYWLFDTYYDSSYAKYDTKYIDSINEINGVLYWGTSNGHIFSSQNSGTSFHFDFDPTSIDNSNRVRSIDLFNDKYIATCFNGKMASSNDGLNWSMLDISSLDIIKLYKGMIIDENYFLLALNSNNKQVIYNTLNLSNWNLLYESSSNEVYPLKNIFKYSSNEFFVFGNSLFKLMIT